MSRGEAPTVLEQFGALDSKNYLRRLVPLPEERVRSAFGQRGGRVTSGTREADYGFAHQFLGISVLQWRIDIVVPADLFGYLVAESIKPRHQFFREVCDAV